MIGVDGSIIRGGSEESDRRMRKSRNCGLSNVDVDDWLWARLEGGRRARRGVEGRRPGHDVLHVK